MFTRVFYRVGSALVHAVNVETYADQVDTVLVKGYNGDVKITWHININSRRQLAEGDFLVEGKEVDDLAIYLWTGNELEQAPYEIATQFKKIIDAVNAREESPLPENKESISEHLKQPLLAIDSDETINLFPDDEKEVFVYINVEGGKGLPVSSEIPLDSKTECITSFITSCYASNLHVVEKDGYYIAYHRVSHDPKLTFSVTDKPLFTLQEHMPLQ